MKNLPVNPVGSTFAEATKNNETHIESEEQHSVIKTLILHLVPGILIYALFLLTGPLFEKWGYPGIMGLVFGSVVILLPTLGELYLLGKKHNGKFSLKGIVLYRQAMPWWQYILWTLFAVAYALAVLHFLAPFFQERVMQFFSWWPGYTARLNLGDYPASHIMIAIIFYVTLNTLLPIIEELYFRGYLMPRLSRFGLWTPFISLVLFSLYHLWQPWNNPLNIIALWPLTFLPWMKRNVYLAIIIHCMLNVVGLIIK